VKLYANDVGKFVAEAHDVQLTHVMFDGYVSRTKTSIFLSERAVNPASTEI